MTREELTKAVAEHPFTAGFRPEHIEKLAAMASNVRFAKNELIFREGDSSSFFYLLLSGTATLEITAAGRTLRIATLAGGEELGWSSLTPEHTKQFCARTLEEVQALAFDGARLLHACEEDCAFGFALSRALLKVVAGRLHATRIQLLDVYKPAAKPAQV